MGPVFQHLPRAEYPAVIGTDMGSTDFNHLILQAGLQLPDEALVSVSFHLPGVVCPHVLPSIGHDFLLQHGITDQSLCQLNELLEDKKWMRNTPE